ncbi:hypothetical protein PMES_01780 [Profundibacterium mesophilum KAUST100406-0324]|uniref:Uncharacterized protein n=1 Tax=Profundibacterium mesophilum KAUST100406-0324 TaxID=1037889 RepID=A0A921NQY4_9RHOB|nr:hypothetical protein PMES_01780 [Profundibacterium mesophilum KAUST100406-0324]
MRVARKMRSLPPAFRALRIPAPAKGRITDADPFQDRRRRAREETSLGRAKSIGLEDDPDEGARGVPHAGRISPAAA